MGRETDILEYDLDKLLEESEWRWAKSYENTAPHWYIKGLDNPLLFGILFDKIRDEGVDEIYTNHKGNTYICRYFYQDDYKYWYMYPVINKAKIER